MAVHFVDRSGCLGYLKCQLLSCANVADGTQYRPVRPPLPVGGGVPVKGLSRPGVYNARVVPWTAFFVRVLVVIEPGDEIDRQGRLTANCLCAMPINARNPHQPGLVGAGNNLYQFFVCGTMSIIVGTDFHCSLEHQEVIHLSPQVSVPGSDNPRIAE